METVRTEPPPAAARLGLWDTTSIIVGIIVGVGIYLTPADVFRNVDSAWQAVGLWVLGGLMSLLGAFCFAELASTYPRSGGEYVYLTRAYGPWMGFLFGWAQLSVIRPAGSIAVVAYGFAKYWGRLVGMDMKTQALVAAVATVPIIVLTLVNLVGVYAGKPTQNALTVLKVLGIGAILVVGFLWAGTQAAGQGPEATAAGGGLAIAMMYVLWTYAGWQEGAYVAAEVRDRRRTLPLALILGTMTVTALYVLINLAYVAGLGFDTARHSEAVAADVLDLAFPRWGSWAMSLLVVISTLGCLNGMLFTSSRIFAEMGTDHPLFAPLGRWSRHLGTPVLSLLAQGLLSVGMVLLAGFGPEGKNGFDRLVEGTAGVFWLFFLLTGVALLVLRWRDPQAPRPFRVPFYPITPLLFCVGCAAMLYGSVDFTEKESLVGIAIVAAGLPLYFLSQYLRGQRRDGQAAVPKASREAAARA